MEAVQSEGFQDIQSLAKFKIIGCGESGQDLVKQLVSDYKDEFENIEMESFNRKLRKDQINPIDDSPDADQPTHESGESTDQPEEEAETEPGSKKLSFSQRFDLFILKLRSLFSSRTEPEPVEEQESELEVPIQPEPEVDERDPDESQDELKEVQADQLDDSQLEPREPDIDYQAELQALKVDSSKTVEDIDIVFLLCNLEEYNSLDNAEIVSRIAHDLEIINIILIELPAKFNRIDDVHLANRMLQKLRLLADIVVVVPEISKLGLWYVVQSVKGLLTLITTPGLVNLDFADLKTIVKGGNVALLGFGSANGEAKLANAIDQTFNSPLLQVDLEAVEKALVNVTGGEDMTIGEAEGVSSAVHKRIKTKSRIILGATVDCQMKDEINIMLMVGATPMQVLINVYAQS
jgi:cell division GTPase FtsZ